MTAAEKVREIGFRRVALMLDEGQVELAWRELLRFRPASMGEAEALARAKRAMPERPTTDG